jgi:hypothetical protein
MYQQYLILTDFYNLENIWGLIQHECINKSFIMNKDEEIENTTWLFKALVKIGELELLKNISSIFRHTYEKYVHIIYVCFESAKSSAKSLIQNHDSSLNCRFFNILVRQWTRTLQYPRLWCLCSDASHLTNE